MNSNLRSLFVKPVLVIGLLSAFAITTVEAQPAKRGGSASSSSRTRSTGPARRGGATPKGSSGLAHRGGKSGGTGGKLAGRGNGSRHPGGRHDGRHDGRHFGGRGGFGGEEVVGGGFVGGGFVAEEPVVGVGVVDEPVAVGYSSAVVADEGDAVLDDAVVGDDGAPVFYAVPGEPSMVLVPTISGGEIKISRSRFFAARSHFGSRSRFHGRGGHGSHVASRGGRGGHNTLGHNNGGRGGHSTLAHNRTGGRGAGVRNTSSRTSRTSSRGTGGKSRGHR